MNRLASSQFKTQYPHLTEPTEVNVNGHYIGTWLPADPQRQRVDEPIHLDQPTLIQAQVLSKYPQIAPSQAPIQGMSQKDRDVVLRKMTAK